MGQIDLYLLFTEPLESAEIPYIVTGSVASIVYGIPRLTHDIDLIVELDASRAAQMVRAFPIEEYYCPPEEIVFSEARRRTRGQFNLLHHETGFKADVYLHANDPFQAWAFSERRRMELGEGKAIWLAPPEYVIVRKVGWYAEGGSEKHIADITGMFETNPGLVRRDVLLHWLEQRDLVKTWSRMGLADLES